MPSFTLKVKLATSVPYRFAGGEYFRLPISAASTVFGRSPDPIVVPESVSVPVPDAGSVTILTLARLSPVSVSVKAKSSLRKV